MKKIIFLFIMILTLTGCKTVEISTSYGYKVTNQKEEEIYNNGIKFCKYKALIEPKEIRRRFKV